MNVLFKKGTKNMSGEIVETVYKAIGKKKGKLFGSASFISSIFDLVIDKSLRAFIPSLANIIWFLAVIGFSIQS